MYPDATSHETIAYALKATSPTTLPTRALDDQNRAVQLVAYGLTLSKLDQPGTLQRRAVSAPVPDQEPQFGHRSSMRLPVAFDLSRGRERQKERSQEG